jgi:hypothetical protein
MFGPATLVPHQEDHGLDLLCTLARSNNGRAEPYAYYSVQIKSNPGPWEFVGVSSVQWILAYPAPVLYCIVNKKAAEFTVYKMTARLYAGLMADPPEKLVLVPGDPGKTEPTNRPRVGVDADGAAELGPPILQFTITDLLDDDTYQTIRQVMDYWIATELRNIVRQQIGMMVVTGPPDYETNVLPPSSGFASFSMTIIPAEAREAARNVAAEHLDWLGQVMLAEEDPAGALLAALLIRHLVPHDDLGRTLGFSPTSLYSQIRYAGLRAFGLESTGVVLPDFDAMLAELKRRIAGRPCIRRSRR